MRRLLLRRHARAALSLALLAAPLAVPAEAAGREWAWPVRGEVVQRFTLDPADPYAAGRHRGIDVAAARGGAVRAACAGRVRFAGSAGAFGRAVTTACGGYVVSYGHLGEVAAARGEDVALGERIGSVGASGRGSTSGPHLHLGVRRAGERHGYVDPLALLSSRRPASPPPLAAPPPAPRSRPPALPARPASKPAARIARPAGTPAAAPAHRVGVPVWVWIGVGLLALGAPGLVVFGRRKRCDSQPTPVAWPPPVERSSPCR